ncbi:MAG: sulfurtransferase [Desulfobulbus propionicus]|nr:MAG: sulfurtransferase [Desulfobulbus propionicus]
MIITDWIHTIAGTFILVSLALGVDCGGNPFYVSSYFLFFTAFVGANLFQFGLTKFCPIGLVLKKLGVPETR